MDEIKVEELKWGWWINIPCVKCHKRDCPGNYLNTVQNANNKGLIIITDTAYNQKEAIDNSMAMAKMWSMYCNNQNP